ncbi:MAGUK p55 subfamily member 2-like [Biomphalaria glabrata]|uniref:MAGUK p55 subfamily member 2-like n=1 Tax=Biomphalaria glabrata TaxID=6526 RepID=A0A9U8EI68_BIOGL|nr:MAGUK p55 subfamily member 2-like [Biomphalaria glabrata]
MPTATSEALSAIEAIEFLADQLDELYDVGAQRTEIAFLKNIFTDPSFFKVINIHEDLEVMMPPSKEKDSVSCARDLLTDLDEAEDTNEDAAELKEILSNPHFRALLVVHDDIVNKNFEGDIDKTQEITKGPQLLSPLPPVFNSTPEQVRFVNIRKSQTEPLGITVKLDEMNELQVARILQGSIVDRQGMLHVGDIIREVNGVPVATPEMMMDLIIDSDPDITLKITPSFVHINKAEPVYMKAHFNWDPMKDRLLPCKEAGLPFNDGDILEIVFTDDTNWWQARLAELPDGPVGLIPSQALEEKRKSFVNPDLDHSKSSLFCGLTKKKKKTIKYSSRDNKEFDKADVMVYEEVRRMAPFERPFLVLVGAKGVGRRSLKERLIKDDPRRFGTPIAHTSRAPRDKEVDGQGYYFTDRESMERDILENKYIEYGEFNFNLYGTRIDSCWDVVKSGKMCVLDVSPSALKILKNQEFMPYIVFIAAPSVEALKVMYEEGRRGGRMKGAVELKSEDDFIATVKESAEIERKFNGYFDEIIVNDNFEETYRLLRKSLAEMTSKQQWVPVNWIH